MSSKRSLVAVLLVLASSPAWSQPLNQGQLVDSLSGGSTEEREGAIAAILAIPVADRTVVLELALTRELNRLQGAQRVRRQALVRGDAQGSAAHSSEYLFSLINAVSQSRDAKITKALLPWLSTGSVAIDAVAGLGESGVVEVAAMATDPANDEASIALLVLRRMILNESDRPLSRSAKRLIRDAAEIRLSGNQDEVAVQQAVELAAVTGDSVLIERIRSLAHSDEAVADLGIRDADAIENIRKRSSDALSRIERKR